MRVPLEYNFEIPLNHVQSFINFMTFLEYLFEQMNHFYSGKNNEF